MSALAASPFERSWRGREPLWKVYWLYGVLGTAGFVAAFLLVILAGAARPLPLQALIAAFALYNVWVIVATWRCAPNAGHEYWGHLARGLTAAWVLNLVLLLGFVELDMVVRPLLP